jgi:hypothetical protein
MTLTAASTVSIGSSRFVRSGKMASNGLKIRYPKIEAEPLFGQRISAREARLNESLSLEERHAIWKEGQNSIAAKADPDEIELPT